jgi:heme o synthase
MSASELTVDPSITSSEASDASIAWWSDYLSLTKPRILVMILLTVVMGLLGYAHRSLSIWTTLHSLIGTALIAASASILNQWLEQDRDSLMTRTRSRPLPSGRLTSFEVAVFGWSTAVIGFSYLIAFTNAGATAVGFATWVSYVWIYTPMKSRTWLNTVVGTLPGALPVLIGWTAAGGSIFELQGWLLTAIVILWQFPHFMAIAWLYRHEYDLAGYRMITNVERTGIAAGWLAIIPALLLIPVSIASIAPSNILTWIGAICGVVACLYQLRAAFIFFRSRNDQTARRLLYASLIYLPAMMLITMIVACLESSAG